MIRAFSHVVCLAALGMACSSVPRAAQTPFPRTLGTFAYRINIGTHEQVGTFTIERDTVTVDARDGSCNRSLEVSTSDRAHQFNCIGAPGVATLILMINSERPSLSSWYATTTTTQTRRVCAAYSLDANGKQFCSRYGTESYDAVSTFRGQLLVGAGAPPI